MGIDGKRKIFNLKKAQSYIPRSQMEEDEGRPTSGPVDEENWEEMFGHSYRGEDIGETTVEEKHGFSSDILQKINELKLKKGLNPIQSSQIDLLVSQLEENVQEEDIEPIDAFRQVQEAIDSMSSAGHGAQDTIVEGDVVITEDPAQLLETALNYKEVFPRRKLKKRNAINVYYKSPQSDALEESFGGPGFTNHPVFLDALRAFYGRIKNLGARSIPDLQMHWGDDFVPELTNTLWMSSLVSLGSVYRDYNLDRDLELPVSPADPSVTLYRDYRFWTLARHLIENPDILPLFPPRLTDTVESILPSDVTEGKKATSEIARFLQSDDNLRAASLSVISKLLNRKDEGFLLSTLCVAQNIGSYQISNDVMRAGDVGNVGLAESDEGKTYDVSEKDGRLATEKARLMESESPHAAPLIDMANYWELSGTQVRDVFAQFIGSLRVGDGTKETSAKQADLTQIKWILANYQMEQLGDRESLLRHMRKDEGKVLWYNDIGKITYLQQDNELDERLMGLEGAGALNMRGIVGQEALQKATTGVGFLKQDILDTYNGRTQSIEQIQSLLASKYNGQAEATERQYDEKYAEVARFSLPKFKDQRKESIEELRNLSYKVLGDKVCAQILQDQSFVRSTIKYPNLADKYKSLEAYTIDKDALQIRNRNAVEKEVAAHSGWDVNEDEYNIYVFGLRDTQRRPFEKFLVQLGLTGSDFQKPLRRALAQSTIDTIWSTGFVYAFNILADNREELRNTLAKLQGDDPDTEQKRRMLVANFNKTRVLFWTVIGRHSSYTDPNGKLGSLKSNIMSKLLGIPITQYQLYLYLTGPLDQLNKVLDIIIAKREQHKKNIGTINARILSIWQKSASLDERLSSFGIKIGYNWN